MFETVEIPVWAMVLILAFAAVTFASHFLFPSVRWFFRRRAERLVARLNERLDRPIEPFKLARRHDTIQRLIFDPEVTRAVAAHAAEHDVPEEVAFEEARRYAREIVPAFSASLYFGTAVRLARWLARKLYRIDRDVPTAEVLRAVDGKATVVFVMNHRSNMDYVLVTYLVARGSALSYAVGEWARVWPLSRFIRSLGAFFIRRRSRNPLYRRVLARYVQMAVRGGVTQAMFPEGHLSLDGRVGEPKLGLLAYIVGDFDPDDGRDVVFVPVALNYDRVLEDRLLVEAATTGERRFRGNLPQVTGFVLRYVWRRFRGRARRFGNAAVRFGEPLSLAGFLGGGVPEDIPAALGQELRRRIVEAMPVLPVPLAAACVLDGPPAPREELAVRAKALLPGAEHLEAKLAEGLDHLLARRFLEESNGVIRPSEMGAGLVRFYANASGLGDFTTT